MSELSQEEFSRFVTAQHQEHIENQDRFKSITNWLIWLTIAMGLLGGSNFVMRLVGA